MSRGSPSGGADISRSVYEEQAEAENNRRLSNLRGLVGDLKQTAIEIGETTDQQNKFLDGLMKGMGGATNAVKGTINRLDDVMKKGGSKHICILVCPFQKPPLQKHHNHTGPLRRVRTDRVILLSENEMRASLTHIFFIPAILALTQKQKRERESFLLELPALFL